MLEKPPIRRGTAEQQVAALHDYLYRLAGSLDNVIAAASSRTDIKLSVDENGRPVYTSGGGGTSEAIRKSAEELKALIIKSADEVHAYTDSKTEEYNGLYVAQSVYGDFIENLDATITTTAQGVVDSYNYTSMIQALDADGQATRAYVDEINGQIRRGIVEDPTTHQYVTGIAISQTLSFGETCPPDDPNNPGDGHTYYYMTDGQTFGLYTSTGWQFWVDGYKIGWFESGYDQLHVIKVTVTDSIRVGNFEITGSNGFAVRYVGA